jgi:hypothetical protein
MEDSKLQNLTLLGWTLQIWRDHRRGLPLQGQLAAIAYCLQNHPEWWSDWDSAEMHPDDRAITNRLIHIHNDAAIRLQVERGQPADVKVLYDAMREKGFTEFETIHTFAIAFAEEGAFVTEKGGEFSVERYTERASVYVKEALSRPNLVRTAKSKAY